jgi:MFS transporter, FSR family, fosmidomycin resistance protein
VSSFGKAIRNQALVVLMLGHFTNDMFAGVLAIMFPVLKLKFGLSNAEIGLATLAYTTCSSLTQPLFGHLADRHARRWYAPLAILWGSLFVSFYGFAPTFPLLLACAAMAGMASGAYHPIGASNAAAVTEPNYRNGAMSLYTVAGTSGYALGPLVTTVLLAVVGPTGTGFLIIPGVIASILILSRMGIVERSRAARAAFTANVVHARAAWGPVARIIGVTMLRSWIFLAVLQFTPIWYDDLGFGRAFYGPLTTIIILGGAIGTLAGGFMADRMGQKQVVVSTLVLTIPAVVLYALFPGPQALILGFIFGFFADASLSVTLVMAQNLVPGRVGVATGVILGLGFITGGVGMPITGAIADRMGIQAALALLAALALAASLLALTIPSDRSLAVRMRPLDPEPEDDVPDSASPSAAGAGR